MAGRFKTYFLRGLAVLLPTVLTIWIFVAGYTFIEANISRHIAFGLNWLIQRIVERIAGDSFIIEQHFDQRLMSVVLSVAGFLVALFVVFIVGALLASVVGRTLWRLIEKFIMNTPLLRRVYPYVKQVTDFLLTQEEQKELFKRVVAVEYPRKGVWSMGFVTGSGIKKVAQDLKKEILTVLIPTSPTPFTGFIVMVPKEQTIELDITVEEALRFAVSAGVITPIGQQAAAALPHANVEYNEKK